MSIPKFRRVHAFTIYLHVGLLITDQHELSKFLSELYSRKSIIIRREYPFRVGEQLRGTRSGQTNDF